MKCLSFWKRSLVFSCFTEYFAAKSDSWAQRHRQSFVRSLTHIAPSALPIYVVIVSSTVHSCSLLPFQGLSRSKLWYSRTLEHQFSFPQTRSDLPVKLINSIYSWWNFARWYTLDWLLLFPDLIVCCFVYHHILQVTVIQGNNDLFSVFSFQISTNCWLRLQRSWTQKLLTCT